MSSDKTAHDILNAPVTPLFFKMAMPIILGLLVNGLYNFVDAIFIARAVGTDGIGGVTAAFPIQMILISISAMMGSGVASILSRRLGANKDDEANRVFNASIFLAFSVGLFFSVVVSFFNRDIFILLELPPAIRDYAIEYLHPIALFSVISFCYGTLSDSVRAQGLNNHVFFMMVMSSLLNISLDALFLFVFEWGVAGAAWATVIALSSSCVYAARLILSGKHRIRFHRDYIRPNKAVHKETIALGIPIFMSYAGYGLMLLIVNIAIVMVAQQNAELLISAHGILNRTLMLIFLPILGMMIAFQTFAGFNFGARKLPRIGQGLKVALIVSTLYCLIWTLVMLNIPHYLYVLFSEDQQLVNTAAEISTVVYLLFITAGIAQICPALFQAMGYAKPSAWLNALHTYVLLIPVLWLSVHWWQSEGIWWTFPIIDAIAGIIIAAYTWFFMQQLNITPQENN